MPTHETDNFAKTILEFKRFIIDGSMEVNGLVPFSQKGN